MPESSVAQPIFLNFDQVTVTEASVPAAFTDDDILQFVVIEQAQLFPMLDQAIYFDFLIKTSESLEEERKTIVIVACNSKDFLDLSATANVLKIDHKDFEALNLLPWRQREKKLAQKKQLNILVSVAVVSSVLMLAISLFYMHMAHQDKRRASDFSHKKHAIILKLSALEKSNQELLSLIYRWKNRINKANRQLALEELFKIVEAQRPENIILDKVVWRENRVLLSGRSKEVSIIKVYLKNLSENEIEAQLKFMGNSVDHEFPVEFEIEALDKKK